MSNLRKKTLDGLVWTFAQQFGVQFINFGISIVLARLLLPAEFGLIGMIAIFIAIGASLVDSGMASSLIRTKDPDNLDYSTVFFTNLAVSIIVYIVVFFAAPYIAEFFTQPILKNIIRVYCLTFIIGAFSTVQSTKLNKEMNFKTQMMINLPSLIASGILGIYLAYSGYGVWSIVYMNLFQISAATIQLWIYSRWTPSFVFDRERLRTHFNFGYKLTLSGMLNTIVKNIYNIIIGKYFSAAQLGFFIRAKSMQELPVINISNALNKVTYPMFASIKDDDEKLRSVYRQLLQVIFFVIAPILMLLIVIAEPLFRFLLTEKWLPSVPYFQILCISGIVAPLTAYNLNILLVKGRSDRFLRLEVIKNILTILGVLLAIPFGIYGLLWSLVGIGLITFVINAHYCGKMLNFSLLNQMSDIFPTFLITIAGAAIAFIFDRFALGGVKSDLLHLIFVSLLFGSIYLALSFIFKVSAFLNLKSLIKSRRKK